MIMGTWYGFYPVYYAMEKGLDKKHGIRLKVLEPTNMPDYRRSYLQSQVDIAASSMLEFTNAVALTNMQLTPIVITDYSNGGDVVIADKKFQTPEQLKGARVAVPSNGIGEYVLSLMFDSPVPTQLIKQISISETHCEQAFKDGGIDACVTYPPISTRLLANPKVHKLFDTQNHPDQIFDIIYAKPHISEQTKVQFRNFWFDAVDLMEQNTDEFYRFVASVADVDEESVRTSMKSIKMLNRQQHGELLEQRELLNNTLVKSCRIATDRNCQQFQQTFVDL